MKRVICVILFVAVFFGMTASALAVAVDKISTFAKEENAQKMELVHARLDETLQLLANLSEDEFICSPNHTFQEKAAFLTDKNTTEGLGYMMLRILDGDINIYREDIGAASSLASREYMQRMYATGEPQITDAFLAGADGKTINYTVTTAIKEDGTVVAGLMAAIYGSEIDAYLQSDNAVNVLVGSKLQYMGGISEEQFGLAVAQVLESEKMTWRPVENILLDFYEKRSGTFWGIGDGIQYFAYSPVPHSDWVVMTEVNALPLVKTIWTLYAVGVAALLVIAYFVFRKKKVEE